MQLCLGTSASLGGGPPSLRCVLHIVSSSVYVTAAPKSQADVRTLREIASMCESVLKRTHTHTPLHPYTLLPRTRSVSLFAGVTFRLLPAHAPYKTRAVTSARRGLLTSTRGDSVVSPGETASITTGLCETLNKTKHTWLLLRNLWKRCPSSRGNVSVGQFGWPFTEWMLFLKHVCKIWSSNYYYFFSSNKKKWSVQHSV